MMESFDSFSGDLFQDEDSNCLVHLVEMPGFWPLPIRQPKRWRSWPKLRRRLGNFLCAYKVPPTKRILS